MSSYTMELRKVCEIYTYEEVKSWFTSYNLEDYLTETQIQTITETNIWNKERLAEKIINHYFMREIGFETPYLFRHFAKTKMSEIMERYLPLIYSKSIEFNPLINVDFTEEYTKNIQGTNTNARTSQSSQTHQDNNTHQDNETVSRTESIEREETSNSSDNITNEGTSTNTGTSSSTSTNTSSGLNVNSDTPQGQISKANILAGNYASSTSANENTASINDSTQTSSTITNSNEGTSENESSKNSTEDVTESITKNSNGTINTNGTINSTGTDSLNGSNTQAETFRRTMKGNSGSITTAQHLIKEYREIIIAVDEQIIEELNSLFIGLF